MHFFFLLSDYLSVWCATGSEMNVMDHFHKVLHSILKGSFRKLFEINHQHIQSICHFAFFFIFFF